MVDGAVRTIVRIIVIATAAHHTLSISEERNGLL